MPDHELSSLPLPPPAAPESLEVCAQANLLLAAFTLRGVIHYVAATYSALPDPPDAEAMGEGTIAESLAYCLRSSMECLISDFIWPAVTMLERDAAETEEGLVRQWQERQHDRASAGACVPGCGCKAAADAAKPLSRARGGGVH